MHQAKKMVWAGLLTTGLGTLGAMVLESKTIEQDLLERTREELAGTGQTWAALRVDGRYVTMSGSAPSSEEQIFAAKTADRIWGVRYVYDKSEVLQRQSPFTFDLAYKGKAFSASGYVPSEDLTTQIQKKLAKTTERTVETKLVPAGGAPNPEEWMKVIAHLGEQLAKLENGVVSLSDKNIAVSGKAGSFDVMDAVKKALPEELPEGYKITKVAIIPPTMSPFKTSYKIDNGNLVQSGVRVSEEHTAALEKAAKAQGLKFENKARIAVGNGNSWADSATFLASQMQHLRSGEASLSNDEATITGIATSYAAYQAVRAALSGTLPKGMILASAKILPPAVSPYRWQAEETAGVLTLSGVAPSDEAREKNETLAKSFAYKTVKQSSELASGAPEKWTDYTAFALKQMTRLQDAKAVLTDKELILTGTAKSGADYTALLAALRSNNLDGLTIKASDIQPAMITPYVWSAVRQNGGVAITGHAPNDTVKQTILQAAKTRFPADSVVDRMQLASGVPAGMNWQHATDYALAQLALLESGEARFEADRFSLKGTSTNIAKQERAILLHKQPGIKIGSIELTGQGARNRNEYSWSIAREGEKVLLQGVIGSEEARKALLAHLKQRIGGLEIIDQLTIGEGAPENFEKISDIAVRGVSRLDNAFIELKESGLSVAGNALYEGAKTQLTDLFSGLDGDNAVSLNLGVKAPGAEVKSAACQKLFVDLLGKSKILFESGKAVIDDKSLGLLDNLVYVAHRCPAAKVEIAGHTDADGPDSVNQRLSNTRAGAVMAYLVKAGIAQDRLKAMGYGETKPIASNKTKEGKAQNRRIEFVILNQAAKN